MRELVRLIDRVHRPLREAIAASGLTSRDYVMAWTTILVGYASVRNGLGVGSGIPPENFALIEQRFPEIDELVTDMTQRIDRERP